MKASPGRPVERLGGSLVYVYSFLDLREAYFTPKVLAQFNADLIARFAAEKIQTKLLSSRDTAVGETFVDAMAVGNSAMFIPVGQIVVGNLVDESASGARYRLLILPASVTISGAWRFYDIRWVLIEIASNTRVWEFVYKGSHLVMIRNSENAVGRSKKLLDSLFTEWRKAGLLPPG